MKMKPKNMSVFRRNRHAALFYDGDREMFVCAYGYEPLPSGCGYSCTSEFINPDPREAINRYEDSLFPHYRIVVGSWVRSLGYNQYTGEREAIPAPELSAGKEDPSMAYYETCKTCGANLDPGERCADCHPRRLPAECAEQSEEGSDNKEKAHCPPDQR